MTFSGNGAVGSTAKWMERFRIEERVQVRTIIFEDGITSIGSGEFSENQGYVNLEKVIFQGNINAVGSRAFFGNRNLTTVEFGGGCRYIGDAAFSECSSLQGVNIPDGCRVGEDTFKQTPVDDECPN